MKHEDEAIETLEPPAALGETHAETPAPADVSRSAA